MEWFSVTEKSAIAIHNIGGLAMFTIAFRNGSNGIQTAGVESAYNEEYLQDSYKSINLQAQIGQTFMDFISIGGNLADSNHPYIHLADGA